MGSNEQDAASENLPELTTSKSAACTNACTGEAKNAELVAPDPQVTLIIERWPQLTLAARQAVMQIVLANAPHGDV
ncbi:MAG TPA: hypothetical protein VMP01_11090 [Pirellulaceae bacterium]|nr:hypothetical protein [Pirellulaceae bacterium]